MWAVFLQNAFGDADEDEQFLERKNVRLSKRLMTEL
jgi:hypothetical protein